MAKSHNNALRRSAASSATDSSATDSSAAGEEFPLYCDFSCPHADFSDPCAVGACRRDIGVWCGKARRFHNKHARCLFRN